jgi:ribosomal protein L11 methyltransferase
MSRSPLPGHYWEIEVDVTPEAEELWSVFCYDQGAVGAQTVRETAERVTLRYYFADHEPWRVEEWPRAFQQLYPAAHAPLRVRMRLRETEDWQDGWRVHFRPTPVGEGLLVCPPWDVPAEEMRAGRRPLVIDPGQGFGTGGHPSTVLALEGIEAHLAGGEPPAAMLDVGIGSGILSVAARLLGVPEVWGLDVDGRVVPEVKRNFRLNGITAAPRMVRGRPDCLARRFPLVAANLTAPVLLAHRDDLIGLTEPGGVLVASGMLRREGGQVMEAFRKAGCALQEPAEREGWCAFRFIRSA